MEETKEVAARRIMYVITKTNWGGAQRYVYDLATAAQASGMNVLVAGGGEGELLTRLKDAQVDTLTIGGLSRDVHITKDVAAFKELYSLFRRAKPEVVHLNSSKAGIAALAARLARVPHIVFTVHGWAWNEERPYLQKCVIALAYWLTLLLSHTVIMVSNEAKRQGRFFPFVQRKMTVIHNGVRAPEFLSREEARRKLLPSSTRSLWIGTIGELHPIKGHSTLIEAYEHVAPDVPDSELILIGEGQERSALERQIRIEGVSGSTHLLGHIPEASLYLRAFDIFVLPSRSEGLPYVLLEAGAASLPVVATAVGGIPEVITEEETGVLVPYGDRGSLTEALEYVAQDETLRRRLGSALHTKVENEFSVHRMVTQTFALY